MCDHDEDNHTYWDEDSEIYRVECPVCGGEQDQAEALRGSLGSINHYRCRYCGARFYD